MQKQPFIRFDAVDKSFDGENYVVRGLISTSNKANF